MHFSSRSVRTCCVPLLLAGLLTGCSTMASREHSMEDTLAEQLKSSKNACIRLQQAEDDAQKAGQALEQQGYRKAKERACEEYEQRKRALEEYRIQHPAHQHRAQQP